MLCGEEESVGEREIRNIKGVLVLREELCKKCGSQIALTCLRCGATNFSRPEEKKIFNGCSNCPPIKQDLAIKQTPAFLKIFVKAL